MNSTTSRTIVVSLLLVSCASYAVAETPKWLEASFELKESYDSNVFYSNDTGANSAVNAVPIRSSFVTTVAPKIAFNGDWGTFGLQAQINWYESASSEDYGSYKFSYSYKAKTDSVVWNLDNSINIIDGNKDTPVSNSSLNAYATTFSRDRREQVQYRLNDSAKIMLGDFYIQPTLVWAKNDVNTHRQVGFQNYVNRYDFNAGVDIGYKVNEDLSFGIGHRYGYQFEDTVQVVPQFRYCNNYNRVLFIVDATPAEWIKLSASAGPDFRRYDANKTAPTFKDNSSTKAYWEGSISLTPTKNDAITFTTKGWQWLSGSGNSSLFDHKYDLTYTRKINADWKVKAGINSIGSDYDFPTTRNDWQHTFLVGATYKISDNFSTSVEYSFAKGDNRLDGSTARDFDRHLVSLSIVGKL